VQGCTGWRYVLEESSAAGFVAHLAEPADIQAARSRKKRARPTVAVRRAHLELFGRWMEQTGRMRSTVARRLSTLASFYR
jgi:hypothetical protein